MLIHLVAYMKRMTRLQLATLAVWLRRGIAAAVALSCLSTAQVSQAAAPAAMPLTECRLQSPNVGGSVAARCGSLAVLEDRSNPSSKRVSLHVAVIPALRTEDENDPLFLLSGGPGQAASDFYLAMSHVFGRIRRDRDIVIVDQRGTGRSNRLDCPLPNDSDLTEADPSVVQSHTKACLENLPGDPRFYTTSVAVEDLDAARAALQYERINLYGISYGTRVAQHYLRRYPARVRAMILDGVVPPELALGPHVALEAQAALDALFSRCSKSTPCNEAFPNLRESFASLGARLKDKPLELTINDPLTAEPLALRFGSAELNGAVRMLTYSDETASTLPLLIHQAQVAQRPQALAAQFEMVKRSMQNQLAYAMHFSVVCTEDAPRWEQESVSEEALRSTYIGADFMTAMRAICNVWPKGILHEDFGRALQTATPVLALSGEFDPITPPAYAQRALEQFTNAKHIVLSGQGHGQLAVGCMPRLVTQFIEDASSANLNEECLKSISPAPFMISSSGPAP
jgi:pimeloyl-ACP methyl ester carboxylesterase